MRLITRVRSGVWLGIGFLLFWLSFAVSGQSVITADLDNDGVSDDLEQANLRDVELTVSTDQIVITSTASGVIHGNQIQYELTKTSVGINITLRYKSASNDTVWAVDRWVELRSVIEYQDGDGAAGFNGAADIVQNQIQFGVFSWDDFSLTGNTLDIQLHDPSGHVKLHVYGGEEFFVPNETPIVTPTQIRLGLEIKDYAYANTGNLLALHVAFDSGIPTPNITTTQNHGLGYNVDERGVVLKEFAPTVNGIFAWDANLHDGTSAVPVPDPIIGPGNGLVNPNAIFELGTSKNVTWGLSLGVSGLYQPVVPVTDGEQTTTSTTTTSSIPPTFLESLDPISAGIGVGVGAILGGLIAFSTRRRGPKGWDGTIHRPDKIDARDRPSKGWDGTIHRPDKIDARDRPSKGWDGTVKGVGAEKDHWPKKSSEEKDRGITINTTHVEYETDKAKAVGRNEREFKGHVTLMKREAGGSGGSDIPIPSDAGVLEELELATEKIERDKSSKTGRPPKKISLEAQNGDIDSRTSTGSKREFKGHVTLMKREGIIPPTEPELPPVTDEAVVAEGKIHTRTGHVTLMKREPAAPPPSPPKGSPTDVSVFGFEPEVIKAPENRVTPSGSDGPVSPPTGGKVVDYSKKDKEYKGHVTLLKRESMPPPPPGEPVAPNQTDLINPIAMDKGLRAMDDPNVVTERKLLDRGQVGENVKFDSPSDESSSVKVPDKTKDDKEHKKEFVGHVSLMK
jgi:hypothetical protein